MPQGIRDVKFERGDAIWLDIAMQNAGFAGEKE
jgi:hypothetical protein